MKLLKTSIAVFSLSSSLTFASENLEEKVKTDQKFAFTNSITSLPKEITADEVPQLPVKQKEKTKKYTAEQKAAICELQLSNSKK